MTCAKTRHGCGGCWGETCAAVRGWRAGVASGRGLRAWPPAPGFEATACHRQSRPVEGRLSTGAGARRGRTMGAGDEGRTARDGRRRRRVAAASGGGRATASSVTTYVRRVDRLRRGSGRSARPRPTSLARALARRAAGANDGEGRPPAPEIQRSGDHRQFSRAAVELSTAEGFVHRAWPLAPSNHFTARHRQFRFATGGYPQRRVVHSAVGCPQIRRPRREGPGIVGARR